MLVVNGLQQRSLMFPDGSVNTCKSHFPHARAFIETRKPVCLVTKTLTRTVGGQPGFRNVCHEQQTCCRYAVFGYTEGSSYYSHATMTGITQQCGDTCLNHVGNLILTGPRSVPWATVLWLLLLLLLLLLFQRTPAAPAL